MNIFTEVYDKSRSVIQLQSLESSWEDIRSELKALLLADGPAAGKGHVLNKLRKKLDDSSSWCQFSQSASAKEILKASKPDSANFQERSALLKAMKHF
jgi:hypothetical protein